jgi:hypothetical protein
LSAINLAHGHLAGGEQRPEQHGRGVRRWQHGLCFDPSLELFVQPAARSRWWCERCHWLGGKWVKAKSRSPASCRLSATARCLSRHLRTKVFRRASTSSRVPRRSVWVHREESDRPRRTLIRASDAAVNLQNFSRDERMRLPECPRAPSGAPEVHCRSLRGLRPPSAL